MSGMYSGIDSGFPFITEISMLMDSGALYIINGSFSRLSPITDYNYVPFDLLINAKGLQLNLVSPYRPSL